MAAPSQEQVLIRIACPGLVRAVAVTPDSVYCAAAIAEKILIWQVNYQHSSLLLISLTHQISTGHLLAVEARHYQPVSVLVFTDDGRWLVSGGEDGRVLVWSLRRCDSPPHTDSYFSPLL